MLTGFVLGTVMVAAIGGGLILASPLLAAYGAYDVYKKRRTA